MLGDVERLDAENVGCIPDRERVHHFVEHVCECERLRRELARVLDIDEDHDTTPICLRTSTTAGAAAGPSPRMMASVPVPPAR